MTPSYATETTVRPSLGEVRADVSHEVEQKSAPTHRNSKKAQRKIPRVKALIMGYYGVGNLGDEMMLFCLRDWLERQGYDLTVLSERPAEVCTAHGLPSVENCPLLGEWGWRDSWLQGGASRVVRAIAQSDALIVGGGDLIRDDMGWKTFLYTLEKMIVALLMKKKVYVVNAGIGRVSTRHGRVLLKWVLERCQRIIVRDVGSQDVCRDLGISREAVLAPDIALSLPELLEERGDLGKTSHPRNPYVAVCLRHNPHAFRHYEMTEERIRTLARSLDDMIECRGVDVVFIPFHANSASGRGDIQLHERVAGAMVHSDRIQVRPWTGDLARVCRSIRGAQFVVAMRLHAAVLAVSCGRPSVLMPYDRKILEFGKLMAIEHAIEAATLDNRAAVGSVLDSAWREAQSPASPNAFRQNVSSIWARLALDAA